MDEVSHGQRAHQEREEIRRQEELDSPRTICGVCGGTGQLELPDDGSGVTIYADCHNCDGKGWWVTGKGWVTGQRKMTRFADNATIQPEAELVSLSCDTSLDEGDAIIRADFAPGIGSTGREYFVQVDPTEVDVLLALIEVAGDCGGDTDAAEVVETFRSRLDRVKTYREES